MNVRNGYVFQKSKMAADHKFGHISVNNWSIFMILVSKYMFSWTRNNMECLNIASDYNELV